MPLTIGRIRGEGVRESIVGDNGGVLSIMYRKADCYQHRAALAWHNGSLWRELSFKQVQEHVRDLSDYLIECGISRGERIAILSESRPGWGITLFASVRCGAVLVPLDTRSTVAELTAICRDSQPAVLFVSVPFVEVGAKLKEAVPTIARIYIVDEESSPLGIASITNLKASRPQVGRQRRPEETALIVYTSGTTGAPKGVMISFETLIFQAQRLEDLIGSGTDDVFLSILPMNHLLELTAGFLGVLCSGGQVSYLPTIYPHEVVGAMRERGVTLMITVPMFLKLLKEHIEREARRTGKELDLPEALQRASALPTHEARRQLLSNIHAELGGKLRGFICGGAPLDIDVAQFFDTLGIPVYQGYGLTETGPIISANTPERYRLGSVGKPLAGVEVRLEPLDGADTTASARTDAGAAPASRKTPRQHAQVVSASGEILTRGPHVMQGYYRQPELTRAVLDDDGWLHTGDIGALDEDGFLYITGRKKNLIVLGAGKKVCPEEVEDALAGGKTIREVCIIGRTCRYGLKSGSEEVCAVVVPDESLLRKYGDLNGAAREEIAAELRALLRDVSPYKRPTSILIYPGPLPKTTTFKIKRDLVVDWVEQQETVRA